MRRLASLSLLLTACACGGVAGSPADPVRELPGEQVPVTAIGPDGRTDLPLSTSSGYTSPQRLVIRSAAEWAAAWATTFANVAPAPALAAVDFHTEMVVLVATGTRPTGGYALAITGVAHDAGGLRVGVLETRPGPDCVVSQALTSVVVAVKVPRSDAPVSFVEDVATAGCAP